MSKKGLLGPIIPVLCSIPSRRHSLVLNVCELLVDEDEGWLFHKFLEDQIAQWYESEGPARVARFINFGQPLRRLKQAVLFSNGEPRLTRNSGVGQVELKDGELYLDGKRVELVGEKQGINVVAREVHKVRSKEGGVLGLKVLEHLLKHPELWPEAWKGPDRENSPEVYFWEDVFSNGFEGRLAVCYGVWQSDCVMAGSLYLEQSLMNLAATARVVA